MIKIRKEGVDKNIFLEYIFELKFLEHIFEF